MKKEQLELGNELRSELGLLEKTLKRVDTLCFAWKQSDSIYRFSKSELRENDELLSIFTDVTETAKTLLAGKIEKYLKKTEKEFEKL